MKHNTITATATVIIDNRDGEKYTIFTRIWKKTNNIIRQMIFLYGPPIL